MKRPAELSLAYYEWEISGHAKAETADRAYISALYNDIVFGCADAVL